MQTKFRVTSGYFMNRGYCFISKTLLIANTVHEIKYAFHKLLVINYTQKINLPKKQNFDKPKPKYRLQ